MGHGGPAAGFFFTEDDFPGGRLTEQRQRSAVTIPPSPHRVFDPADAPASAAVAQKEIHRALRATDAARSAEPQVDHLRGGERRGRGRKKSKGGGVALAVPRARRSQRPAWLRRVRKAPFQKEQVHLPRAADTYGIIV